MCPPGGARLRSGLTWGGMWRIRQQCIELYITDAVEVEHCQGVLACPEGGWNPAALDLRVSGTP